MSLPSELVMALTVLRLSSCGVDNLAAELVLGGVDDLDLPELFCCRLSNCAEGVLVRTPCVDRHVRE